MKKIRVTLPEGRIVDGVFTTVHNDFSGTPVLIVDDKPYSALAAIEQGLLLSPINDPIIDAWLNTIKVSA